MKYYEKNRTEYYEHNRIEQNRTGQNKILLKEQKKREKNRIGNNTTKQN